ncbi:MAG: phosphoribosylformylglycinamidine synthase, partial [Oscillospiraceae bacterium]|nr:phosphoribosylformylglycinamidine synthase [Oscillospiraceae bacterium]
MVYRVFVEKKPGLRHEAESLLHDINEILGIPSVTEVRLVNRYDAEGLSPEAFNAARATVFAEPQLDDTADELDMSGFTAFAVEYLPGQFDQRADSAAQCIQILTQGDRPEVRTAKIYLLAGDVTGPELEKIKKYVINPVEAREAGFGTFATLKSEYAVPEKVAVLTGFRDMDEAAEAEMVRSLGLAMDRDDLDFCRSFFRDEGRDPTITEIRMIDTYWSDHCRHTTFLTHLENACFEDPEAEKEFRQYLAMREAVGDKKPVCLMDMATVGAKYLKKQGILRNVDESEEINACTVKIKVTVDEKEQDWLLLFKNETHNHPTEIEPFGGAATCIGGAIRDPLSGRSYVYAAMRVTGAADPTVPVSQTPEGKLPRRKIVTGAAQGYSSYGNQIGLATGIVSEVYHEGYAAKRMEIGAVIAAAPQENVRRERPAPGDIVILLGGRTGRDGIGGATGSSKAHDSHSVETCGAEVQKGNAPEERKLQRLFRRKDATTLIKRCNDFGAGGVSVAVGELADGLSIDLGKVPKKYEGLDGTELAISESQERMAVVVAPEDKDAFLALAAQENLEATVIAVVTEEPRLVMTWNGAQIVNISREFLNTNGAPKKTQFTVSAPKKLREGREGDFRTALLSMAGDLNIASQRGLSERFDSTIGAASVLMPFGGRYQRTPIQAMVHRVPLDEGMTDTVSFMAWGYDPLLTEASPLDGAYTAVVESVSKLIATGAEYKDVYLTFQEYFPKPLRDPRRWGLPAAALLGALKAQRELGAGSIGGKDSMSGSFEDLDVPPTLVSFAVTMGKESDVVSPEFKEAGHKVWLLSPDRDERGRPQAKSLLALFDKVTRLCRSGRARAVYTPGMGGIAEAVVKMSLGNGLGFRFETGRDIFARQYGSFVVESDGDIEGAELLGETIEKPEYIVDGDAVSQAELLKVYDGRLEGVYPTKARAQGGAPTVSFTADHHAYTGAKIARPRVIIPVFPGTNCEYDTARAFRQAGAQPEVFVIRNRSREEISASVAEFARRVDQSQIVFIPGGFSGGDEPEGSGKFITAFFRSGPVRDAVSG